MYRHKSRSSHTCTHTNTYIQKYMSTHMYMQAPTTRTYHYSNTQHEYAKTHLGKSTNTYKHPCPGPTQIYKKTAMFQHIY